MSITLKKASRMILIPITALAILFLTLVIVLWFYSPGKPQQYVDNNGAPIAGSVSEKTFVTIGGIRQGMFIKSKNIHNPVLLYLHGGIPDYFLTQEYPTGLEDYFTVVWWEQRGFGLSYSANIPAETMNVDQMISDTKEVTNYLRTRFGQDKIYLMGRWEDLLLVSRRQQEHRSYTMPTSALARCRTTSNQKKWHMNIC